VEKILNRSDPGAIDPGAIDPGAIEYWILNRLALTPLNHRAVSHSIKNSKSV